jgi:hypothetical protein
MVRIRRAGIAYVLTVSMAVALAATTAGAVSRGSSGTSVQGVTDKEIQVVVLVSDLDGLRSKGIQLAPKLTTDSQLQGLRLYADAFGPINGRKVVFTPVTWDPTDTTTYDKACVAATQDNKPFVILNQAGWRPQLIPCITVDNATPLFLRDPAYDDLFEASGDRLLTLLPPSDVIATATADLVAKQKLVPKSAKVGILSSNDPGGVAAGDAVEARLNKLGYDVVNRVEVNALSGDTTAINRETAAAVATFQAAGVDTVFSGVQGSQSTGFFQESARANAGFKVFLIDDAPNMCATAAAQRLPVELAGTPCLTTAGTRAVAAKNGVAKDSKFEAKCRSLHDAALKEQSQPGVPAGDVTSGGVTYTQDMNPDACTMINLLLPAIKQAGKNLTWNKVVKNLQRTTATDAAYMSGGDVGFGKNKPYAAKNVHLVALNNANGAPQDAATGTFNGCPAPVNCWVPQLVDKQEWFPLNAKTG